MKKLLALAVLALSCSQAFAASKPIVPATVLENIPTTSSYNWGIAGQSHTSCYGSSCSSYYSPASDGTAAGSGAVVKLLLTDGHIVIVSCSMKPDNGRNVTLALLGAHASTIYRNCRIPAFGTAVTVQFDGNKAKLFMQELSLDGNGKKYSETYQIVGILNPVMPVVPVVPVAPVAAVTP